LTLPFVLEVNLETSICWSPIHNFRLQTRIHVILSITIAINKRCVVELALIKQTYSTETILRWLVISIFNDSKTMWNSFP
jgi:hypothetical protein